MRGDSGSAPPRPPLHRCVYVQPAYMQIGGARRRERGSASCKHPYFPPPPPMKSEYTLNTPMHCSSVEGKEGPPAEAGHGGGGEIPRLGEAGKEEKSVMVPTTPEEEGERGPERERREMPTCNLHDRGVETGAARSGHAISFPLLSLSTYPAKDFFSSLRLLPSPHDTSASLSPLFISFPPDFFPPEIIYFVRLSIHPAANPSPPPPNNAARAGGRRRRREEATTLFWHPPLSLSPSPATCESIWVERKGERKTTHNPSSNKYETPPGWEMRIAKKGEREKGLVVPRRTSVCVEEAGCGRYSRMGGSIGCCHRCTALFLPTTRHGSNETGPPF